MPTAPMNEEQKVHYECGYSDGLYAGYCISACIAILGTVFAATLSYLFS